MPRIRKISSLAAALAAAFTSASAYADKIDLNAEIVKRLDKAGQLKQVYKQATGTDMPATMGVQLYYQGSIGGKGVTIATPPSIPASPLVLMQSSVVNCNTLPVSEPVLIQQELTNTTSFENSDQYETTNEFSMTLGYSAPWGGSASATATNKTSSVNMKKQGGSSESKLTWNQNPSIPIAAQSALTVQLVVTQERLEHIPYTANFIVDGPAKLVFGAGAAGFTWVDRRGSGLPTQPFPPLSAGKQSNGAPLYICRVMKDGKASVGKSHGDVCYLGLDTPMGGFIAPGYKASEYQYLVGQQSAYVLTSPYGKNTFYADDKQTQVCIGAYGGSAGFLPGFVSKDGQCVSHWDNRSYLTRNYTVLVDPTTFGKEVSIQLSSLLPEKDRTFDLHGFFSGAMGVNGMLNISAPRPTTQVDCPSPVVATGGNTGGGGIPMPGTVSSSVKSASASSAMAAAPRGVQAAAQPVVVKRVPPSAPLAAAQSIPLTPTSK
jgi:hypothetical protein